MTNMVHSTRVSKQNRLHTCYAQGGSKTETIFSLHELSMPLGYKVVLNRQN